MRCIKAVLGKPRKPQTRDKRSLRLLRKRGTVASLVAALLLLLVVSPALAATAWIEQSPTGTPPAPRYSAGQAYDAANDRLILFSGEDNTPLPRPTDVWVLTDATGIGGTPTWTELVPTGGPPFGRVFGTVVYAPGSNRIIVFGGCSANCSPNLSDVWVLTNANGLGGMPAWTQLFPSNPFGRSHHAAAYDAANNRMLVFGGNLAFPGTDQNDVRVLTNADGTGGAPTWITLAPMGSLPPIREHAAVAYDRANNRMIMFGGGLNAGGAFQEKNDVWVLTNGNGLGGPSAWTELAPAGSPPPARAFPSADYDPVTNQLIVFGGYKDLPNEYFNDVWILTNANGLGGIPEWIQLSPGGSLPPERTAHSSAYSSSSSTLVIAMGGNQTAPLLNDVWVLTGANGILEVSIDIKPGSFPNSVNPRSLGVLPVAILTTVTFDSTSVDPATVLFGATGSETGPVHSALEDVDGDGDSDLILHFNTQATGIQCGDTSASLGGKTFGGQVIQGSDSADTVGCK